MSESKKSAIFAGTAVLLALLAWLTTPKPATPDVFLEKGEPFFPEFTNPNDATSLEVVAFDEETAEAKPFKVVNHNGLWTIPSEHDYPADGKDRLAKTAAGVIGIKKDDISTDNVSDYEACGVIDPLDEGATSLKGRGKRITIRGKNDQILADLILGKEVPDRKGFHYVRLPDQKRVYVSKVDLDISTDFNDWIEKDLLEVDRAAIDKVVLRDYSIDERTYAVDQRDTVNLENSGGSWKMKKVPPGKEIDTSVMSSMLGALDDLKIVGVRPKPAGLSEQLTRSGEGMEISQSDLLSLQSAGYYFARNGALLSNEGEVEVGTRDGVLYTLRFGEIVSGQGEGSSGASASAQNGKTGAGENRYLFITTEFDPSGIPEPPKPANMDFQKKAQSDLTDADKKNKELDEAHEAWEKRMKDGKKKVDDLNARFAKWYYVIPADAYSKVHLNRAGLLKPKTS